jgi:hypothetical protein
MIGFDSYAKTAFEIFIESRIRSFLFVKMHKLVPLFSLLAKDQDIYEEFIEKSRWFELQPKLCKDGSKCPDNDCAKCEFGKELAPDADALKKYEETKTAYFKNLKELRSVEKDMRDWYYSWQFWQNQWQGGDFILKRYPWAQFEEDWLPPGARKEITLGHSGTTPRDPENKYNKLSLWKSKLRKYWKEIDGWGTDEDDLESWVKTDFIDPVMNAEKGTLQLTNKCNVLHHFLYTHMGDGINIRDSDEGYTLRWWCAEGEGAEYLAEPSISRYPHYNKITKELTYTYPEKDGKKTYALSSNYDVDTEAGYQSDEVGYNDALRNPWSKCQAEFNSVDSKYMNFKDILDGTGEGSFKDYKDAANAAGKSIDVGFMGLLEQSGVLRLYNLAAYVVAVGAGRETADSKEKIAENMMKEIFLRVFKKNMESIKGVSSPAYNKSNIGGFIEKYNKVSGDVQDLKLPGDIEYKLSKYNIMIDDAIYNMVEPIK